MSAKDRFNDTIARSRSLIALCSDTQNQDLLRSAVVIAVAALDMYAADKFMEYFVPYVKKHSVDDTAKFLQDVGMTLADAIELLCKNGERPFRRIRTIVERGYEKTSMQSFWRIDRLYEFYGFKSITKTAIARTKLKSIGDRIGELVRRRHAIAHGADYDGRNRLQTIESKWVKKRICYLERFVEQFDEIVDSRLIKKGRK